LPFEETISSQLRKTAVYFKASGKVVVMPGAANTPSAEKPQRRASAQQPRAREASVLEREAARAEQIWLNFKALREAAAMPGLDKSTRASLSERAWELVDQAEPMRVRLAARWLGLSDTAARNWIEAGLLEPVSANGRGPLRVTMASIAEAKEIVDELRALGEDRNLVQLVLARIEGEELAGNRRFGRSLEQMARSQRGEWPEGF